jgi:KDO2-lipid IV(A) lauroyltransferase
VCDKRYSEVKIIINTFNMFHVKDDFMFNMVFTEFASIGLHLNIIHNMTSSSTKSMRLGTWFAHAVFACLGVFPLSFLRSLGTGAGWLLWVLPGGYKRRAILNIAIAFPELSATERQHMACESMQHVCQMFLEMPYWWRDWSSERVAAHTQPINWALADELLAKGKGLILISPHLGSYELLGSLFSARHPSTVLFKPPRVAWLRDFIKSLRTLDQLKVVPADASGVRALVKTLLRGQTVGLLPDQVPVMGEGEWAPFFGQNAYTMRLVHRLQTLTGAPVIMLCVVRQPGETLCKMEYWEVPTPWPEDPVAALTLMNQNIERAIRLAPTQYLWGYNRYRKPNQRKT